jgi:hypothetical protein
LRSDSVKVVPDACRFDGKARPLFDHKDYRLIVRTWTSVAVFHQGHETLEQSIRYKWVADWINNFATKELTPRREGFTSFAIKSDDARSVSNETSQQDIHRVALSPTSCPRHENVN